MSELNLPSGYPADTGQAERIGGYDGPMISRTPFMDKYTAPVKRAAREIIGRQREMTMLEACLNRPELCNALLLGEAGSGKACSVDTWLPVADSRGYIRLGDVKIGDYVFDENGRPVQVLGVFPQGRLHAYEVRFSGGKSVICNDEHLWGARTYSQHYANGVFRTYTLRTMMDHGLRRIELRSNGKNRIQYYWYVPRNKAVQREEREYSIHPYALGVFFAGGDLIGGTLCVRSDNEAAVRYAGGLIGAVDLECLDAEAAWGFLKTRRCEEHAAELVQVQDLKDLPLESEIFGVERTGRRIPPEYLLGSVDQRQCLLRGIMDAGGGLAVRSGRTHAVFSTESFNLASDVRELAASLGYRTSLEENDNNAGKNYSLYFNVNDSEAPVFWHRSFQGRAVSGSRILDDAITDVIDLGRDEEMLCIYVDGPSHLFQITKDYIVTHNTALVQGLMAKDEKRIYLEVNLAKMIADFDPITLGNSLTQLFKEVNIKKAEIGKEVVLFIDEFHQIVQLSPAAVEAMKPLLADSGTRGVKVIAATTYIEFREYIAPNQPLVERLQRINLVQPGKTMTVGILKGVARTYGVDTQFYNDSMYETIYEITNRYIPANSQPRKSILVMDAMVGYHRATGRPLDKRLLADVIYESEGVNIMFRVDAENIKKTLDAHVYAQELATSLVTNRLHIAVADLNDKSKPMASFLFCGSTGTGKGVVDSELIPVYTPDGSVVKKRNGDLVVGDHVFNRKGEPVLVTGVYHRGMKDVYKVTLGDGRSIVVDGSHLWTWRYARGHETESFVTTDTEDLIRRGLYRNERNGRKSAKIWIPVNEAVQYPERELPVDPYVLGALLGNGCLTVKYGLVLSSGNRFVPDKVAERLGALEAKQTEKNYNWQFVKERVAGPRGGLHNRMFQRDDVLAGVPELIDLKSHEKFIPYDYKYGSVEQRWELIRGLFDTDGSIGQFDGDRFNISYSTTSYELALGIQDVLFSLGIASTINNHGDRGRSGDVHAEYDLHVKVENDRKYLFFTYPKKLDLALKAQGVAKTRYKLFNLVPIVSIEKLPEQQPTTCIMVDDSEHLYQAGQYIVTHNTELSKTLTSILFGNGDRESEGDENQSNNRNLIRFDMSEFSNKTSLERFRTELTARIWERPYSVVLLDEIEKACAECTRLLLQVLDDGRLSDENGRQVTFTNCYIIMTTNAGSEIFRTISQYNQSDTGDGAVMKRYNKLIRQSISQTTGENRFPPELLGRIDAIIPFQPLSENTMRKIVMTKLQKLIKDVSRKHSVELRIDKRVVDYLVLDNLDTDSNSGGARIVVTKMIEEVVTPIARFINENPDVRIVGVEVAGDMAWEHKDMLESNAYIKVAACV